MPARLNPKSFVWDWMIKVSAAYCSHRTFIWIKIHSSTPHVAGLDAKCSSIPHLMIDLNREEPAEMTAVQSPCRRSGCGFFGDMARWHLSSWLVGCERWRGQCEPELVCRLSPFQGPSAVIKNGSAVKPSTTSALRGIMSCSFFGQTPDGAFRRNLKTFCHVLSAADCATN